MKKLTVALISGGISSEREVSLNSGNCVYDALNKEKYKIIRYDPKTDIKHLVTDASKIDIAFLTLHGCFGEDGRAQGLLDFLGIPYQGTGVLGSAIAMNKLISKQLYEHSNLTVPPYIFKKRNDFINVKECVEKIGLPMVVKPINGGSSIGMSFVKSSSRLKNAIDTAFKYDDEILLESYIKGIELTGGVIGNDKLEALPIVEIIPNDKHDFFDYDAKYTVGATQEICPARIDDDIAVQAQICAKIAHNTLCCKGYSRTDMILQKNKLYVLETNTIPGMTPISLLPLAAKTAGISFSGLLDTLIKLGIENHQQRESK